MNNFALLHDSPCPHAAYPPPRDDTVLSNASPIVLGVLTTPSSPQPDLILSTWASLLPDAAVGVRFVRECSGSRSATRRFVCVDQCARDPKAIAWLRLAPSLFPRARWIGKVDDDAYVQTVQVHSDLSQLEPRASAYGLINLLRRAKPWRPTLVDPRFGGNLEDFGVDPIQKVRWKFSPFLMGAAYVLSRDLLQLASAEMAALWARVRDANATEMAWRPKEDAIVGHAIHQAARRARRTYRLHHLTWTRLHNFPAQCGRAGCGAKRKAGGMGWVYPSAASTIVHWLKSGGGGFGWERTHAVLRRAHVPAFAPFVFTWNASRGSGGRFEADEAVRRRWASYRRHCWIFGCHAPHRGANLSEWIAGVDLTGDGGPGGNVRRK